jgi:hypothetical protein
MPALRDRLAVLFGAATASRGKRDTRARTMILRHQARHPPGAISFQALRQLTLPYHMFYLMICLNI